MNRFAFIQGPYYPPQFRLGQVMTCEVRDCDCVVTGITDARIPWPKGKPKDRRAVGLIITGDLVRAIQVESNQAVAYWWGVAPATVTAWRRPWGFPGLLL